MPATEALNGLASVSVCMEFGDLAHQLRRGRVVLAIYFWIALCSAIIVWAASPATALTERRNLRRSDK